MIERKTATTGHVNELRGRARSVSLPQGFVYDEALVEVVDDSTWVVHLALELTERFDDLTVKQIEIRYPLLVKRYEVNWKRNPWGLAITGFGGNGPERLDDNDRQLSMKEIR